MDPGKFSYKNMEQDDLRAALECRNGDLKKFCGLYEKYADKIYKFVYYRLASDGGSTEPEYIPDEIQVVYPILVDGNKVSYGYNNFVGLNVSVDIRSKLVGNVNGLNTQNYEKSQYEKESDSVKN
ncbi:hypothetical protein JW911_00320 [Candidatus Peregrinibacteria bacterium]|nr:hypothetical protein [Candidatus Peregrinibacteria bacterium]